MPIQTLVEFQQTFAPKPVQCEVTVGKDAITVFLKPLTSVQRDAFEASVVGQEGKGRNLENLRARLVADCLVNADGKRVGSAKELGELDAQLIGALFDKVRELNGMAGEESIVEAGKD
jgi:hypothetical protein